MTKLTEKDLEDIELVCKETPNNAMQLRNSLDYAVRRLADEIRRLKTEMNRLAHIAREAAE